MRLAMSIDLDLCVGCKACVSACKEQWDSGPGAARDWVHTYETGARGKDLAVTFYPGLCMQCEDHPCTVDCPTGATYVDPRTGVVMIDRAACIGCANCVSSCPYGARHPDPVKKIVEKCNLCAPFVARGEEPACVQTCPAECRIFGDLDDSTGRLAKHVAARKARPLVTADVDVKPKTTYAGDLHRARILEQGVVRKPERSWLTQVWSGVTMPLTRTVVPAVGLVAVSGGLLVNLKARMERVRREEREPREASLAPQATAAPPAAGASAPGSPAPGAVSVQAGIGPDELHRHRLGMRLLHWFNAASWLVLLATGVGLMAAASFAFFGQGFPRWLSRLFGGTPSLLRFHVWWGLAWAATIVPVFLLFKHGGREVLDEIRITREDLHWLIEKPLAMAGLVKQPLPPQDKYNAGQKLFAVFVLVATTTIIGSGLAMTFHLGSPASVAGAILVHKLSIALVAAGLAVHIMAAVIADERPALRSMITGRIDYQHARHHSPRWVARVAPRSLSDGSE
jgi:sulfite dehydrogenase (quinone) subunit SoeB